MQWHGVGLEAFCAHETKSFTGIFDDNFLVFQCPFQAVPGKIVLKELFQGDDQIAAVGPVKSPPSNQGEICHERSHVGFMLNFAEQVEVGGIAINRIENGKIVEDWEEADMFGWMQQLGMELKPKEGE